MEERPTTSPTFYIMNQVPHSQHRITDHSNMTADSPEEHVGGGSH